MAKHSKHTLPLILAGAAVAAGSLFSMQALASGYMQDAGKPKAEASEGKCGEGKCGAGMMGGDAKQASGKRAHKPHTLVGMDTDKDGRISRTEFKAAHDGKDAMFAGIDTDRDGFLSQKEFDAHHAAMGKGMGEGKCGEGKCGGNP